LLGPALKQANAMDFDDLLLFPLTLFVGTRSGSPTGNGASTMFLVDEFQDTNAAQYGWCASWRRCTPTCASWATTTRRFYGWRGADVRHMLSFQRDFPGATLIKLEQNYRSTQVISTPRTGDRGERAPPGENPVHREQGGEPVRCSPPPMSATRRSGWPRSWRGAPPPTTSPMKDGRGWYRTNAAVAPLERLPVPGIPYRLVGP